jgi:O-antigen ligase
LYKNLPKTHLKRKSSLATILLGIAISGPPRPRFRTAEEALSVSLDWSAMFELFVWIIIFIYATHIIINNVLSSNQKTIFPSMFLKGSAKIYFIYSLICFVSFVYSALPIYTIYFALKFVSFFIIAAHIAQKHFDDPWVLFKILFKVHLLLFIATVISYTISPASVGVFMKDGSYRLIGKWIGGYGMYAATISVSCIIVYFLKPLSTKKRLILFFYFIIALWFMYMARTRSTFMLFTLTVLPILFFNRKFKYTKINLVLATLAGLAIIFLQGYLDRFLLLFLRDFESLKTLSGRTVLLEALLKVADQFLPFGDGFQAGSRYWLIKLGFAKIGLGDAHDTFSKVLSETGIPGLIVLTITLFLAWVQILRLFDFAMKYWRFNRSYYHVFLLTLIVGGFLLHISSTLIADASFASGSPLFIIYFLTLQMLIYQKNIFWRSYDKQLPQNLHRHPVIQ